MFLVFVVVEVGTAPNSNRIRSSWSAPNLVQTMLIETSLKPVKGDKITGSAACFRDTCLKRKGASREFFRGCVLCAALIYFDLTVD